MNGEKWISIDANSVTKAREMNISGVSVSVYPEPRNIPSAIKITKAVSGMVYVEIRYGTGLTLIPSRRVHKPGMVALIDNQERIVKIIFAYIGRFQQWILSDRATAPHSNEHMLQLACFNIIGKNAEYRDLSQSKMNTLLISHR